jgi:hypothetical protein
VQRRPDIMRAMFVSMFLISVFVSCSAEAQTFRCDGKVVSRGDTKADVIMKCGEPALKDSREEKIIEKVDADTKRKVTVIIDEWTYNLGPDMFMRVLKFTDGKLVDIREAGYGYATPKPEAHCDDAFPDIGATKAEVRAKCGEPILKEERKEEILVNADAETKRTITIIIEEWTYNFGPNKFIRIFQFKNGKLVDIKTGGYGN